LTGGKKNRSTAGQRPDGDGDRDRSQPRKPLERLLYEAAEEFSGSRVLCTSTAGAQAAAQVARLKPDTHVVCNYFDIFLAESARRHQHDLPNLEITCQADLPAGDADCVALTLPARGENGVARELIQTARQRIGETGRLFASTDNPGDSWVHQQLRDAFGKVTNREAKDGRLYIASRPKPLKKIREFQAWFAFRDQGHLFDVRSRPGVFSHRKLDLGARALIESLSVPDGPYAGEAVQDGFKVLDLGCGSGAVGFAASARADSVTVHALDANVRAIECARSGANKNTLCGYTTQLECRGECKGSGSFDLVLANPPYFSNYRIAEVFLKAAKRALRPGGRTHFVTKQPKWYVDAFAATFTDVSVREVRSYFIIKGTQPERPVRKRRSSSDQSAATQQGSASGKRSRSESSRKPPEHSSRTRKSGQ